MNDSENPGDDDLTTPIDDAPSTTAVTEESSAPSDPPSPSAGVSVEGLAGVVIRRSDVASMPEQPIDVGVVVVVPARAIKTFWATMGFPTGGPPVPGKVEFRVDPAMLPEDAEAVPIVQGRFQSGVAATSVLLCLADDLPGDEQGPPFQVNGCARYDGGGGSGPGEVRLSSGFGGVMAEWAAARR